MVVRFPRARRQKARLRTSPGDPRCASHRGTSRAGVLRTEAWMTARPFLLLPLLATMAFACGSAGSESDDESSTGALETNASTPEARECSFESIKPCEPQDSATRQRILGTMIAGLQKELRDQD